MKRCRARWNRAQLVLALALAMLVTTAMPLSAAEEFPIEGEAPLGGETAESEQLDFDTTVKGEEQTDSEGCPEVDISGTEKEASVEADSGLPLIDETTNGQNHPLVGKWKMVESVNRKGTVNSFKITVYSVADDGTVKLDWGADKKQTGKWDEKRQTLTVFKNRRYLLKDGVLGGSDGTYSGIALKTNDARMGDTADLVGTWEMTERRKTSGKNDVINYNVDIMSVKGSKVRLSWGSSGVINGTWNSKARTLKVFKDQVYVFRWGLLAGGNKNYSGVAIRKAGKTHPLVGEWKMVESVNSNKKGKVNSFKITVFSVSDNGTVKLDWGANKNQTGKWDEARQTLTVFKNRRYLLKDGVLGGSYGTCSGIALKTDDERLGDTAELVGTWEMTERRKTSKKNDVIKYKVSIVSVKGSKVRASWGDSGVIDGTWNSKTRTLKVFTDRVYVFRWGMLAGGNKNYSGVAIRTGDIQGYIIGEEVFPDANFRGWVAENLDRDGDKVLTAAECEDVQAVDVSGKGIANLKGIELFVNLKELRCSDNQLTGLDVSKNSLLRSLHVAHNQIATIDIQNCLNLQEALATIEEQIEDGVVQWWDLDENGDWVCFLSIDYYTNLVSDGRVIFPRTYPTHIGFDKDILEVSLNDMFTLVPILYPGDAVTSLYWSSSDEDVARVDDYGNVVATGFGSAVITVFTDNGLSASCTIIVNDMSNPETYRALLIGEEAFDPICRRNRGDVTLMAKMLRSIKGPDGGAYGITMKFDLSKADTLNAINSTFAAADSDDVSLFFIATHGDSESYGSYAGALAMIPDADYLLMEELADALKKVPGKVIVILEACGSGAGIYDSSVPENSANADLNKRLRSAAKAFDAAAIKAFSSSDPGLVVDANGHVIGNADDVRNTGELRVESKFYVLTASRYQELSWGTEYGPYNYFTKWLTDGIGTSGSMPADTDNNGATTLNELFSYISDACDYGIHSSGEIYYQHVQVYPNNSDYVLFMR